jgi:hypothetical protein
VLDLDTPGKNTPEEQPACTARQELVFSFAAFNIEF